MIREFFVGVPTSSTAHSQDPIVEKEWDAITVGEEEEEKGWWEKLKDWWAGLETWEKGTIVGSGGVLLGGMAFIVTRRKGK